MVHLFVLFTYILYFSGLLDSGWLGCLFVLMSFKERALFSCIVYSVALYIFPLPGLLGSWLSSFIWFTWLTYSYSIRIVYLLQVVYAYSVYPSLCHCYTTDEPYLATGDL